MADQAKGDRPPTPRGRAAAPPERRRGSQRDRIFDAATAAFAEDGYAATSVESIAKRAGMSKATFYERFADKDECLLALFDHGAWIASRDIATAMAQSQATTYREHAELTIREFLRAFSDNRNMALVLLSEIDGAGAPGRERRENLIGVFAAGIFHDNQLNASRFGVPAFRDLQDALISMYAAFGMLLRMLRTGQPEDPEELVVRLARSMMGQISIT